MVVIKLVCINNNFYGILKIFNFDINTCYTLHNMHNGNNKCILLLYNRNYNHNSGHKWLRLVKANSSLIRIHYLSIYV